ncbi:MAG: hypothetical protein A3K19_24420 [Lentisphaerae bacterium RIFOXYB12_FULL_65_16]|nr:MAG: hypothetical protein A3K18_05505 [Lentisphaerae bacterium RIFOXYA12_64_32]OGV90596.1 MAG: hypothetical protein A3K19_24420 [Lentisphaerae bacterium RIFOXYB12_FULL_65_16]
MIMRHLFVAVAIAVMSSTLAGHGTGTDPVFYAPFEGSPDAARAVGEGKAESTGPLEFVSGYLGQGLRLVPGTRLAYPAAKQASLQAGTVMFWFKPEWEREKPGRVLFFDHAGLTLLRFWVKPSTVFVQVKLRVAQKRVVDFLLPDWPKGEWVHVALAWDATKGTTLYLNGVPAGSEKGTWDAAGVNADATFRIDATVRPDEEEKGAVGVIDEYALFDQALDADTIRARCLDAGASSPVALPVPVFSAPFEDNVQAQLRGASVSGEVGVSARFEAAVSGQGLAVRRYAYDQKASLAYRDLPLLADAATVACQFRPDWNGADGQDHELLNLLTEGRGVELVKTADNRVVLRFRAGEQECVASLPCEFRKGEFGLLAIQWDQAAGTCLLGLGSRTATAEIKALPPGFFAGPWTLWLGSRTADRFEGAAAEGVFDDVRVYHQAVPLAALAGGSSAGNVVAGWHEETIAVNAKAWSDVWSRPYAVRELESDLVFYAPGSAGSVSPAPTESATSAAAQPLPLGELKAGDWVALAGASGVKGTVAFWARTPVAGDRPVPILALTTAAGRYRFLYDPILRKANLLVQSGDQTKSLASLYCLEPGEWHQFAITWRDGRLCFWIDATWQGVLRAGVPPLAVIERLGWATANAPVVDLGVWRADLEPPQLATLFNAGLRPAFDVRVPTPRELDAWALADADRLQSATRERICLSGLWRFQPRDRDNLLPPPDAGVYYSQLPGRWITKPYYSVFDADGSRVEQIDGRPLNRWFRGWYTRYVDVPDGWRGKPVFFTTTYAGANAARIYANNHLVLTYAQQHADAQGEMQRLYADLTPYAGTGRIKVDVFLYFNDYFDKWNTGDASLLDVALERTGPVFAQDVLASPAALEGKLRVAATLRNPRGERYEVTLVARVRDAVGQVVYQSQPEPVALTGAAEQDVGLTVACPKPRLWSPAAPALYTLALTTLDAQGNVLDESMAESFGFRDFALDVPHFRLNGEKFRLFYSSSSDGIWERYSQYYAAHPEATEAAVRTLQDNGFNAIGVRIAWHADQGALGRTPHAVENVLRAADRAGMLVVLWAPPLEPFMPDEDYRLAVRRYVRAWGNHPSVCLYLATFNTCHYSWGLMPSMVTDLAYQPPRKEEARALALHSEQILRELDPTRVVYHNASLNLTQLYTTMQYMSFGMPLQEREDWPSLWSRTRLTAYMASEFGLPYISQYCDFAFPRTDAIMLFAEHAARYVGDAAYGMVEAESPVLQPLAKGAFLDDGRLRPEVLAVKSLFARNQIRAWRGYDVSGMGIFGEESVAYQYDFENRSVAPDLPKVKSWGVKPDRMHLEHRRPLLDKPTSYFAAMKDALRPVLVTIAGSGENFNEKDHAWFAGAKIEKQAMVVNDTLEALPLAITVEFLDATGKALDRFACEATVAPGEVLLRPFVFTAPAVTVRTACQLRLRAERSAGGAVGVETFAIQVFPPAPALTDLVDVGLYDPRGLTRAWLTQARVRFRPVSLLADAKGLRALVVGREALGAARDTVLAGVEQDGLLEAGLNVLVFEQGECNLANLIFEATSQRYVFIRAPEHAVLTGFAPEDFVNWRGASDMIEAFSKPDLTIQHVPHYPYPKHKWGNGGIVATHTIRKPQYGGFRPLLDCGFDLRDTPLLELQRGRGRVVLCQLDVTRRYGTDPVATHLAHRLLRYVASPAAAAAAPSPVAADSGVVYYGTDENWLALTAARAAVTRSQDLKALGAAQLLLLAPGGAAAPGQGDAVSSFVRSGGTVVLLFPAGVSDVEGWLPSGGTATRAEVFKVTPAVGRAELAGLGPSDFYWRTRKSVTVFGGAVEPLAEPAVVAVARQGAGRYVLCGADAAAFTPQPYKIGNQEAYSFIDQEVRQKALRIWLETARNLGLAFDAIPLWVNECSQNNSKDSRGGTAVPDAPPPADAAWSPYVKELSNYDVNAFHNW